MTVRLGLDCIIYKNSIEEIEKNYTNKTKLILIT